MESAVRKLVLHRHTVAPDANIIVQASPKKPSGTMGAAGRFARASHGHWQSRRRRAGISRSAAMLR